MRSLEGANDVRLSLDTVTFIRAIDSPGLLSKKALAAMVDNANRRELSAISLSEIAIKQLIGKLELSREDALAGIADLQLRVLPYTADTPTISSACPFITAIPLTVKSSRKPWLRIFRLSLPMKASSFMRASK